MLAIKVEINQEDIKNLLQAYSGSLVKKAIRSALDRTGTWGKNYLADLVSQNYNVKASEAKKTMIVIRSTQTNLSASVETKGRGLSLIDYFHAIQDPSGVTATIIPGWTKQTPHAFINRARNSRKRVVMLRKETRRYPTTGKPGWGPPVPALLGRSKVIKPAMNKMQDHLYSELANQISKRTMATTQVIEIE